MRSTGHAWSYKAWCSAVISCFSTALTGAFRSLLISDLLPRRSAVARLSCCCVFWSWASTLREFLFHYPCWCCQDKVLCELPVWPCACSNKGHDQQTLLRSRVACVRSCGHALKRRRSTIPFFTDWGWCESNAKYWSVSVGFLYTLVVRWPSGSPKTAVSRKASLLSFSVSMVKRMEGFWLFRCCSAGCLDA